MLKKKKQEHNNDLFLPSKFIKRMKLTVRKCGTNNEEYCALSDCSFILGFPQKQQRAPGETWTAKWTAWTRCETVPRTGKTLEKSANIREEKTLGSKLSIQHNLS